MEQLHTPPFKIRKKGKVLTVSMETGLMIKVSITFHTLGVILTIFIHRYILNMKNS